MTDKSNLAFIFSLFGIFALILSLCTFSLIQNIISFNDLTDIPELSCYSYVINNNKNYYWSISPKGVIVINSSNAYTVLQYSLDNAKSPIFLKHGVYPIGYNNLTIPFGFSGAKLGIIGEIGEIPFTYYNQSTSIINDTVITFDGENGINMENGNDMKLLSGITLKNLRFRANNYDNYICAVNLNSSMGAEIDNIVIDVNWNASIIQPKINSIGLLTGKSPFGTIVINSCFVTGYYNGYELNADTVICNQFESAFCHNGIFTNSGISMLFNSYHVYGCVNGFLTNTTTILQYTFNSPFYECFNVDWIPDNTYCYMFNSTSLSIYNSNLAILSPSFPAGVNPDTISYTTFARGIRYYAFSVTIPNYVCLKDGSIYSKIYYGTTTGRYFDGYLQPHATSTDSAVWGIADKNNNYPFVVAMDGSNTTSIQIPIILNSGHTTMSAGNDHKTITLNKAINGDYFVLANSNYPIACFGANYGINTFDLYMASSPAGTAQIYWIAFKLP